MHPLDPYFSAIEAGLKRCYDIAGIARKKGLDPSKSVDIPIARNMGERVEGLVSTVAPIIVGKGIPKRIAELETQYGSLDWRIALTIAEEIAKEKFCKFQNKIEAMEVGLRVGFAYLTMGSVSSPLEGFIGLEARKRRDGREYIALNYAGPVRSAGGTGASVSVIIGDYLRTIFGYAPYDPTPEEVKRAIMEVVDYHERVTNLQYYPSEAELEFMASHLPVQIDGPESSELQVSNYRDIPRIPTNYIRGGFCLVMAECLCQKAPKLLKNLSRWWEQFNLKHWDFLEGFVKLQKQAKAAGSLTKDTQAKAGITPDFTYIKDIVAGRPVLSHPLQKGGLRLRYGRSRFSGYSAVSMHPATMLALGGMIGIGTQLKMERPGKGATVTPCSQLQGPVVKLEDGSVVELSTIEKARECRGRIQEILHLGDLLVSYGDFFNRAHPLVPAGYCEEWWVQELERAIKGKLGELNTERAAELTGLEPEALGIILKNPFSVSVEAAFAISRHFNLPLHPAYTYHWLELDNAQLRDLLQWFHTGRLIEEGSSLKLVLPMKGAEKRMLELCGIPHIVVNKEFVVLSKPQAFTLKELGLLSNPTIPEHASNPLEAISAISGITLRNKGGTTIGARMGRPEKGKLRKLKGSPHVLFPVGAQGGRMRSFQAAIEAGKVSAEFPTRQCVNCNKPSVYPICERCGSETEKLYYCPACRKIGKKCTAHSALSQEYALIDLDIKSHFEEVAKMLGMNVAPDLIKGVKGTSNKSHQPEHLGKGLLRASHDLAVNKDGTIRFDMTQLPVTHFKPREIGTDIERLRTLGYTKDIHGNPLEHDWQVVELFPQDIILPRCTGCFDEGADRVFLRVAQFIDDMLVKLYHLKPFYNAKDSKDLIGQLFMVLAPHTSAGVVARLIGFSNTQGLFAHPMLHAATRRDCDGDEASAMLLLDPLINFSKAYLPAHRGSTQDAPLVLVSRIAPTEVDDMVLDLDIAWSYPLELYEAALEYKAPYEVKIEQVAHRVGKDNDSCSFGYTHETEELGQGVLCSSYKTLPTMEEKLALQMALADKIRAVDSSDVARLVIEKHFIRDIKGNLRKFSMQQFRCVDCNRKFRRPPLSGKCSDCGGNLLFTISKGSIVKYLEPALQLAQNFSVAPYLRQSLELVKNRIEEYFGREKEKQAGLKGWV